MEGHCSTGQSPNWAAVPMEEEEEDCLGEQYRPRNLSKHRRDESSLRFWRTFIGDGTTAGA